MREELSKSTSFCTKCPAEWSNPLTKSNRKKRNVAVGDTSESDQTQLTSVQILELYLQRDTGFPGIEALTDMIEDDID
jgi:hypothetical protein